MSYCPHCGVEIGDAEVCPLCGARNPARENPEAECHDKASGGSRFAGILGGREDAETLSLRDKKKIAWEVVSVAFGIATVALLAINFLISKRLSWSLYPVSSFAFLMVLSAAFLVVDARSALRYALAALDLPAFLLALGLFTGDITWAWRLAVPIAIFSELIVAGIALLIRNARRKGLNIIAYVLTGAAIDCLGIEIFVDLFADGNVALGWSAITAIALVPIAAFLMYLHYRVAKTTNLRRLFKL